MPPQFPTMLRSRLSGGRVAAVRQHGFDRMAEIEIERGDDRYVLIAEIFPKGNVLLLDAGGRIVPPLRPLAFRDRKPRRRDLPVPGGPARPPDRLPKRPRLHPRLLRLGSW